MIIEQLPNMITVCRIIGTALILPLPYSKVFLIIYTLCGVTDILDGLIARTFSKTSELGAHLDSIADLMFYSVMFLKIVPRLGEILSWQVWLFAAFILLLRVASYVTAAIKYRRFASLHTYMNKMTGCAVFILPYFMYRPIAVQVCLIAGIIAAIASAEELIIHLTSHEYDSSVKTLIRCKRVRQNSLTNKSA